MTGRGSVVVAVVLVAALAGSAAPAPASPGIVPGAFQLKALNANGTVDTVAGSHPYELTATFELNSNSNREVEGSARDAVVGLPAGFVGNPTAVPRCSEKAFDGQVANCPAATQVGTFIAKISGGPHESAIEPKGPVYNLVPPAGAAASLGFSAESFTVVENATLIHGGAGGYRVSVATSNISKEHLLEADETVWGVPSDSRHDGERECLVETSGGLEHSSPCSLPEAAVVPFLTLPTSCAPQLPATLEVDFLEALGTYHSESSASPQLGGCEALDFHPTVTVRPETTSASTATGLHVDVHLPQEESAEGLAEADLETAEVALPEGVVLNPSSANGREACSSAEIALETTSKPTCPAGSKLGTLEVRTPLVDHPLKGSAYLAAQNDNPFHSLIAIYLVIDDVATGVVVKLAGHVEPDPVTGQLKTTFSENPQFPFEDFKLDFEGGPRAPLITPETCGVKTTRTTMMPWTFPEHGPVQSTDSFSISSGAEGGACVSSPAQQPNGPSFEAGTVAPVAGAYSPFVLDIARRDGSQPIGRVEVALPPGLSGKLAGIARCSDEQIAAAAAPGRTGSQEQASPSCPAASEVGIVNVAAGAGPNPVNVLGHAYLAGPYEGAPFSIAIVTPAVAGPFDLGTVVVRSALVIDPVTAQVTVRSDPLPTILDGIPLDIRDIRVYIDRSQFTLNPTSCERLSIAGVVTSIFSQAVTLSNPFQVGGCAGLPFKAAFSLSTDAKTSRLNGASLRVKLTEPAGRANIRKVKLQLPSALPSRLTTIQKACTEAQFAAAPEAAACPEGSHVGSAKAVTPLLDSPLEGQAYLVSHGGAAFPDLVFLLSGEGIHIKLVGNTDIKKGITYSRFEAVPDQPITSFEATFPEGPHSVLAAFGNLCAQKLTAPTTLVGQNGLENATDTPVAVSGCPKPTVKFGRRRVEHRMLVMAITVSQPSLVVASGRGMRTTRLSLKAGRREIRIPLLGGHPRRTKLKLKVKGVGGAVARTASLSL